ncbi:MAG: GntR family transcriptional regulator [Rhodobacteraceae bacterium]|nr:GntR family transcriptional regulator [Paracoccaceae bacterium]
MELKRADRIAEALEQMIVTGEFADGERLDEIRLAEMFGVSRTPIREAFQRLISAGLVESRPRRGVFVHQLSPGELLNMFEVMAELEAICGRLAASRIRDSQLEQLREANEKCRLSVEAGDADAYYRDNETFHDIIYNATENAYLVNTTSKLHKRLRPFRRVQLRFRGRLEQSMSEHDAIVAALEAGDGEKAAKVLHEHVAVQGEKFHRLMSVSNAAE